MNVVYPDRPEMPNNPAVFHTRYQIVIPCCDQEQMDRISEKIKGICGHDKEAFFGITTNDWKTIIGEVPIVRERVGTDLACNSVPMPIPKFVMKGKLRDS